MVQGLRTPFVGRSGEIRTLREAVVSLRNGRGSLILVTGEPGIGKTRLAEEFAQDPSLRELTILWGRCWERPIAPPFWLWTQIIRSYKRPGANPCTTYDLESEIPLLDFLAQLDFSFLGDPSQSPDRFRAFDRLATFLQKAASRQPLVLLLDDLHWADRASLILLEFLVPELTRSPILLIGTYRDVEVGSDHPLRRTLGELARHGSTRRIHLYGLVREAVASLVTTLIDIDPLLVDKLYERSEGNPFFLVELLRLLATENSERWHASTSEIPDTVRTVIFRRLHRLSAETNVLLSIAAVIGREFDLNIVQHATSLRSDDLVDSIDECLNSRVLLELPNFVGRYRFSHALLHETLYEATSLRRRLSMHSSIVNTLECLYPDTLDAHSAQLSFHCLRAAPLIDTSRALDYTIRAAQYAATSLAYEEAVTHYQQALAIIGDISSSHNRRCYLLLSLGDAQNRTGEWLTARDTYRSAAKLARRIGDPDALALAAIGLKGLINLAGPVDREAVALLEEALEALGDHNNVNRVRVLYALSSLLSLCGEHERCDSLSQTAVTLARTLNNNSAIGLALCAQLHSISSPSRVQEAIAVADRMLMVAVRPTDAELSFEAHLARSAKLLQLGRLEESQNDLAHCALIAQESRHPRFVWQMAVVACGHALLSGDLTKAEVLLAEAAQLARRVPHTAANHYSHLQTFLIARTQNTLETLADTVSALCDSYPDIVYYRVALAGCFAAVGNAQATRRILESFSIDGSLELNDDAFLLWSIAILTDVCSFLNDRALASSLYQYAIPYSGQNIVVTWGAACDGPVSHYLGILAGILGDWPDAKKHLNHALRLTGRLHAPLLVARTELCLAQVLARSDTVEDRSRGWECVQHAINTYEQTRSVAALQAALRVRANLEDLNTTMHPAPFAITGHNPGMRAKVACGGDIPGSRQDASSNLFRREGDYWTVVFQGRVNRVRNTRGLEYLFHLLSRPHQSVHALDLTATYSRTLVASDNHGRLADQLLSTGAVRSSRPSDAGSLLDARALNAYRDKLRELRAELSEAEEFNDLERASQLRTERDELAAHLAASMRRDGRSRRVGSYSERARISVRNNISAAMKLLERHDAMLARHLHNAIRTGSFCSYAPEQPICWTF